MPTQPVLRQKSVQRGKYLIAELRACRGFYPSSGLSLTDERIEQLNNTVKGGVEMSRALGKDYAELYDVVYQNKDYSAECDILERLFKKYLTKPVRAIIDLGCGTGNHAIPLASRGYSVVGIDRSGDMLKRAKLKARQKGLRISFKKSDIKKLKLNQVFDAALMMFAVLGYQVENNDALAALKCARSHVHKGGLFITDFWYGPAVLAQRPGERIRTIKVKGKTILRTSSGDLDIKHKICKVKIQTLEIHKNKIAQRIKEEHSMRFFFNRELEILLKKAGFKLIRIGAFPDFDLEPDENTWNVLMVARAI